MRALRRICFVSAFVSGITAFSPYGQAQERTAPNGYYPNYFTGRTFTGRVESVDNDRQELTLAYTNKAHEERFIGSLDAPCSIKDRNGAVRNFGVSGIPKETVLMVLYVPGTDASGGQSKKQNHIFAVSSIELEGKKIPDDKRVIIYCSPPQQLQFMVF